MNVCLTKLWTLLSSSWSQTKAEVPISKKNTIDSAQGTYLELHTWYPYENSERCNPAEGTVPVKVFTVRHLCVKVFTVRHLCVKVFTVRHLCVKVFTVRHLCDITINEIFKAYYVKHWQGCHLNVYVELKPPFVYPHKHIRYNDTSYQNWYKEGCEIELLQIIRNTHKKKQVQSTTVLLKM